MTLKDEETRLARQADERWSIVEDLANTNPYGDDGRCKDCRRLNREDHRSSCLILRARKAVNR